MRKLEVKDAVRRGQKARVVISGPTGSGKTWTLLEIATVLTVDEPFVVIDTENESASLYSDVYKFKVINWTPPYDPKELAEAIRTLQAQYPAIVIDSLTHFWTGEGGTLDIVDRAANGNSYAGWRKGTPAQQELHEAVTRCTTHILAGMRSKMDYVQERNDKTGKTEIRKVGMGAIQRDGMEYEFTIGGEMTMDHELKITKTRCAALADKVFRANKAKDMALTLKGWLESAAPSEPRPEPTPTAAPEDCISENQRKRLMAIVGEAKMSHEDAKRYIHEVCGVDSSKLIPKDKYDEVIARIRGNGSVPQEVEA